MLSCASPIDPGVEQPYVFLGRMLDQTASKLFDVTAAFAALAKANPKNYNADFLHGKAWHSAGSAMRPKFCYGSRLGRTTSSGNPISS
jgi:hypothetical protein